MNDIIDAQAIIEIYGMMIPFSILIIENDEDRAFMATLYVENKRFMLYLAKKRTGNFHDAEDIVEEAILSLLNNISVLKSLDCNKLRSYLVSTIRNTCINYYYKHDKHNQNRVEMTDAVMDKVSAKEYESLDFIVFDRANAQDFLHSFHSLSSLEKDIIMMRHVDAFEMDEIAKRTGLDKKKVSMILFRAKAKVVKEAASKKNDESSVKGM